MGTISESVLEQWKTYNEELVENVNDLEFIQRFSKLLNHVEAVDNLMPIRLLKKYHKCVERTQLVLAQLLDHVELDGPKMPDIFKLYKSFASIRIIQTAYAIGNASSSDNQQQIGQGIATDLKWYDLSCLLPLSSQQTWKKVYRQAVHKNTSNAKLFDSLIELYVQKLRFLAIAENLDQFQDHTKIIRSNAKIVVDNLVSMIETSNQNKHLLRQEHQETCCLRPSEQLVCALLPYMDSNHYPIICDAIIQDHFLLLEHPHDNRSCSMDLEQPFFKDNISVQTNLITAFLKHLRNNILRNKRKKSDTADLHETQEPSLLSIIDQVTFEGMSADELIEATKKSADNDDEMENELEEYALREEISESLYFWPSIQSACNGASTSLTSKTIQTSYITNWLNVVQTVAQHPYLVIHNRLRIFAATSIVLFSTSPFLPQSTVENLLKYLTGLLESLPQKEAPLFFRFIPDGQYLIKLTNCLVNNTEVFQQPESCPIFEDLLSLFLSRYMNHITNDPHRDGSKPLSDYIAYINDEKLDNVVSTISQICVIKELLSTNLCTSRRSVKKARTSMQLSVSPNLLTSTEPSVSKLKRMVIENQEALFVNSEDKDDMNVSLLHRASVCTIRLMIVQKDVDGLRENANFLRRLFEAIVTNVGSYIKLDQVKLDKYKNKKKRAYHLCHDQFIDLIEFYNRYRTQLESTLNLKIIPQLSDVVLSSITLVDHQEEEDQEGSKKLFKGMTKQLKTLSERSEKLSETIIAKSKKLPPTMLSESSHESQADCYPELRRILLKLAPLIFSSCDTEGLQRGLNKILEGLLGCDVTSHSSTVRMLLLLESVYLASPTYNLEKSKILIDNFERILRSLTRLAKQTECRQSIHLFKDAGVHKSYTTLKCCIHNRCLRLLVLFFRNPNHAKFLREELTFTSLQIISSTYLRNYAQNSQYTYNLFLELAGLIYSVLNECLLKRTAVVIEIMPTFNTVFQEYLRCIIIASDKCKLESIKESLGEKKFQEIEHRFEVLAMDSAKIMTQLSLMRTNFIGCAPYLITSYIKDIQLVTCHPRVRLHLNEGIFRIFNQIDAHQKEYQESQKVKANQRKTVAGSAQGSIFEMVHTRLDQSSREIFRDMHDNYEKFHRFTGRY